MAWNYQLATGARQSILSFRVLFTQTVTVQRGNIVVSTTSAGNLAFIRSQDVAYDISFRWTPVWAQTAQAAKGSTDSNNAGPIEVEY